MFGQIIKKHCVNCNEEVQQITTVLYAVDGNDYVKQFNCPHCKADLAQEDRAMLEKAKQESKDIIVIMC